MTRFHTVIYFSMLAAGCVIAGGQTAHKAPNAAAGARESSSASNSVATVTLNDSKILQQTTKRVGINLGAIEYYDNGQLLKNLIGYTNPGFEPLIGRQIWGLTSAGTTSTFEIPDKYDTVAANYWAGAVFSVVASQSGGKELGCTGKVASNTGPNSSGDNGKNPVVTTATPCAAPFNVGDIVILTLIGSATPEAWWENGRGGYRPLISGNGKLLSETTDLCSTCGSQALRLDANSAESSAGISTYYDSSPKQNLFVLMNGTYQISFWAKAAAGLPKMSVSANRLSAGGFSCGSFTPNLTSSWTQFTFHCSAAETQKSTTPGTAQFSVSVSGGAAYLDNVSFQKIGNSANPTVFRDEVINALQSFYSYSSGGEPGMLRYWVNQNGETVDNWTKPDYARKPTVGGALMDPNGPSPMHLSLNDFLVICSYLHAEPYLEVPATFTTQEAAELIEFLAGPSNSSYGARRAALGQSNPWTSIFNQIHLAFCNECWNGATFPGASLPWRNSQPANEYLHDYTVRTRDIFAAMRASRYYSSSSFDLVMNAQTAVNWTMDTEIAMARPDSIEVAAYTYSSVSDYLTDDGLWGAAMVEPYDRVTDSKDPVKFYTSVNDYQSQKTCGASGTATCKVNIYEWGQGTVNGSIDQQHMDYINAGAGEGAVSALESLLNLQYFGLVNNSYFSLAEFSNGAANHRTAKLWGNVVDMGGATNNKRPQFLALSLVNQSIIGPMYSCPISYNTTYNFSGSSRNGTMPQGMRALTNVQYLYAFCFKDGSKHSIVLINTDLIASHTVVFSGTNPPSGTVTQRQYAPAHLNDMNEAPTGTSSNLAPALVKLTTTTMSSPASLSLPPHSVTALDYTRLLR